MLLAVEKAKNDSNQRGNVMDPEKIMDGISEEIVTALNAMKRAKTSEERLKYSEIIKNLCESLGVFLSLIGDMSPFDDDDGTIPF